VRQRSKNTPALPAPQTQASQSLHHAAAAAAAAAAAVALPLMRQQLTVARTVVAGKGVAADAAVNAQVES